MNAFKSTQRAGSMVLSIENLSVSLPASADRTHAVQGVSLQIEAGRICCLVGESGSGKSVIASAVMGLLPGGLTVSGGRIELQGESVLDAKPNRYRELRGPVMSMVFQEPMTALNPVMTCGAQIEEMLAQHVRLSPSQLRARTIEILTQVQLPDPERAYRSYPHQLSGGQRQRIVIAIALILRPALLICDEPTTALDVTTQAEILRLIRDLQTVNGTAVLFITHDFGVVADIADDVVVLRQGQIVEAGPKEEVLLRPQQHYTRALLAAVPQLVPAERAQVPSVEPLLEVRALGKTYGSRGWFRRTTIVDAARDVSLVVRPGETVGIVGESGSGKSTIARCIARLIEPSSGEVLALGQSVQAMRGQSLLTFRRSVQMVFQDPYRSLNPRRTVGESIIEGPLNFGVSRAAACKRAEELMELVSLRPDALRRYPNEFSGGQRQRISIARALACEPRVLIADEAVSALDVSVQAQILELLATLQRRLSLGMLFITHDLRVASQICDQVIVMSRGAVVESGPTHEVFFSPKSQYTRQLLAAAPGRGYDFGGTPATN